MYRSRIITLLSALLIVASGCAAPGGGQSRSGSGADGPPSAPKRIVVAIPGVPPVLDSRFDTSTNKVGYSELARIYNNALTVYDDDGALTPQLSESVPTVENGGWKLTPDGKMETRWTIRQGAAWHDGTPLTTRDLLFTEEVSRDKTLPQSISTGWRRTVSIAPISPGSRFPEAASARTR